MINFSGGRQLLRKVAGVIGNSPADLDIRADLAGLLVISFVASYENAVKKILIVYADNHNDQFSFFVEKQFDKLNSRISLDDLKGYAKKFDEVLEVKFANELLRIKDRLGDQPFEGWYDQLLRWRHAFAHAGQKNTTIEEVFKAHQYAKYVLFAFYKAFSETSPSKKATAETMFKEFLVIKEQNQSILDECLYFAEDCELAKSAVVKIQALNIKTSKVFTDMKKQKRNLDFYGMRSSVMSAKDNLRISREIGDSVYSSI